MEISELLQQRKRTRAIAECLSRELIGYLQAIAPLLNPRGVFGEYLRGGPKLSGVRPGKALRALQTRYEELRDSKTFSLPRQFDTPIPVLSTTPQIHPLGYPYTARSDAAEKQLRVTSPLRWALTYDGFGLTRLQGLIAGKVVDDGQSLQEAVLHALLLASTVESTPGLRTLLEGLRFPISIERQAAFGPLPIVVLAGPITTRLPDDRIIIESTEISGSTDFEEIVEADPVETLPDPLRDRLRALASD